MVLEPFLPFERVLTLILRAASMILQIGLGRNVFETVQNSSQTLVPVRRNGAIFARNSTFGCFATIDRVPRHRKIDWKIDSKT